MVTVNFSSGSNTISGLSSWRQICAVPDGYAPIINAVYGASAGNVDYAIYSIEKNTKAVRVFSGTKDSMSYIAIAACYLTDDPYPAKS